MIFGGFLSFIKHDVISDASVLEYEKKYMS